MRILRLLALSVTLAAVVAALLAPSVPPARASDPLPDWPTAEGDPPGANDWSCRPTDRRPVPVVLVHGTFGDRKHLLERLSATLADRGYCVYSLDYGNRGTGPIGRSARQLADFVDRVLAATGARRVSFVGHSQGGMMPRYYLRFLGGAPYVDDLVGLAPSNHGTTALAPFEPLRAVFDPVAGAFCHACLQQRAGSDFLQHLNAGDETPGPVSYTNVTTRYDRVVVPHTSGYLSGARTTNVTLQQACPGNRVGHVFIPTDPVAIQWVLAALRRPGPADPAFRPAC